VRIDGGQGQGQGGVRIDGAVPGGDVRIGGDTRGSINPGSRFDGNRGDGNRGDMNRGDGNRDSGNRIDGNANTTRDSDGRRFDGRNFDPRNFDGRNFDGDRRTAGFRGTPGGDNPAARARNFNHSWYSGSWANRNFGPNRNFAGNNFNSGFNRYGLGGIGGLGGFGYGGLGTGLGYGPFGYSGYGYGNNNNGLTTLLRIGSILTGNGGYGYGMGGLGGLGGYGGYGLGNYGGYGLFGGYPLGWGYGSGLGNFAYTSGYLPYMNPYYTTGMGGWNYAQPIPTMLVSNEAPSTQQQFDNAVAQFKAGDYQSALVTVDNAIKQNPSDSVMHEFRALTLFALGNYPSSAATIHSVLSVGPGWDWATMSNLYDDIDVYTAQLRQLESAVKSNPDNAENHFLLAYHYTTAGHPEAAGKQLAEVVRINQNDRLAADLLKMNQVAQQAQAQPDASATAQAPAQPPAPPAQPAAPAVPVDPKSIVGTWHAERDDGTKFNLQLSEDNKFTWNVNHQGKDESLSGTFGVEKDLLALESPQAGGMVGKVEVKQPDLMTFKMLGSSQEDPGLTFRR
jgi:tetratricopeptide (TPR) repeat protein